MSTFAKIPWQQ